MAPAAATIADLRDDLLQEVFIFLLTPADLIRAALACKPFLRAVRSASFLRRFRRRHPFTCPPVLGCFLDRPIEDHIHGASDPLLLPVSPAAATRRFLKGGDFALSFLPARGLPYPDLWKVLGCRNGRLLLRNRVSGELAVADPFTRRSISLPAPPAKRPVGYGLVADDVDPSVFQAFCISRAGSSGLRALALSSGELRWADVAGLALAHKPDLADSRAMQANRSLYWGLKGSDRMVELNTVTMEFAVLELPPPTPSTRQFDFQVIDKGDDGCAGALYLLTMCDFCIEVWGGSEDGSGGLTWKLVDKSVRFQRAMVDMIGKNHFYHHRLDVIGVVAGGLFLRNGDRLLSIDLETMKLRVLSKEEKCPSALIYPYTVAWPPSFLSPTEESA